MGKSAIATALAKPHRMPVDAPSANQVPANSVGGQMVNGNIEGNFPPGIYKDSVSQAMAPFMGSNALPTGQTINVSMNAPSNNLTFKEWALRGVVGGLGNAAAWPFRFLAGLAEDIARMLANLVGKIVMILLIPTALIVGYQMAMKVSKTESIEQGASDIAHNGRHAAKGFWSGLTDDLPAEEKAKKDKEEKKKDRHAE